MLIIALLIFSILLMLDIGCIYLDDTEHFFIYNVLTIAFVLILLVLGGWYRNGGVTMNLILFFLVLFFCFTLCDLFAIITQGNRKIFIINLIAVVIFLILLFVVGLAILQKGV